MINFATLLRSKKATKHKKNAIITQNNTRRVGFAYLLGGKKQMLLSLVGLFFSLKISSQAIVNSSSHTEETKSLEITFNSGENHLGLGAGFLYYYRENLHLKLYGVYRDFNYKSYSEQILEAGFETGITVFDGDPRGRYTFFNNFNFTITGGLSLELVKVTSQTILLEQEEYPNHFFVYLGSVLEYPLSESLGLNAFFRQYYATNGSREDLGNWRYDFGLGLRYYIFR